MAQGQEMAGGRKVLVLTVGEGKPNRVEETVVTPFRKSIEAGNWELIVLLPSKETEENARLLESRFGRFPLRVCTLRERDQEENTDACFRHFDQVLARLLDDGYHPEHITADITRGTRAMTAALGMAAMAHQAGCIRYIKLDEENGEQRLGTERVVDGHLEQALRRQKVNQAREYLRAGDYRAVERAFPGAPAQMYKGFLHEEIRWLGWAAQFWGAWDRFDYKEAAKLGRRNELPKEAPSVAHEFLPDEAQLGVLKELSGEAPPKAKDNAAYCRALAADVLANAARRLREGQNEEVLVRLYRVLELMGQMRLFAHGIDSGKVNPADGRVRAWLGGLKEEERPRPNREGMLELGREKAAALLHFLESRGGDVKGVEVAEKLRDLKWLGEWGPAMRNTSVLIHGYRARSRGREGELQGLLGKMENFFREEAEGNAALLEACRFSFLMSG